MRAAMATNPDFNIQFTPELIYRVVGEEFRKPPPRRSPPPSPPSRGLPNPRVLLPRHHALPPSPPFAPKGENGVEMEKFPKEREPDAREPRQEEDSVKGRDERQTKVTEPEQREEKVVDEGFKPRDVEAAAEAHSKADVEEKQEKQVNLQEKPAAEEKPEEVARDLQPLRRILERNDKRGEELRQTGLQELDGMVKRAKELQEKKLFKNSFQRTLPCLAEKEECIKCYQTKDAARCKHEAEAYIRCTTTEALKSAVS